MATRGRGNIVNLGSLAGQIGLAVGAACGATKAALTALTRTRAAEFSPSEHHRPGPTYTEGATPGRSAALGETTLLALAAQAEEIADVIAFLVSPDTSPGP
jgi:NAD(P)-dependent dehydrogenase (short-subunit alcohol dehydrogenase family)